MYVGVNVTRFLGLFFSGLSGLSSLQQGYFNFGFGARSAISYRGDSCNARIGCPFYFHNNWNVCLMFYPSLLGRWVHRGGGFPGCVDLVCSVSLSVCFDC